MALKSTRYSRHALPHAARNRHRRDMSPAAVIAGVAAVVALLVVDTAYAAQTAPALMIEETNDLDVVLTVQGRSAPTFQVFKIQARHTEYVVELPGLTLDGAALETRGARTLLD